MISRNIGLRSVFHLPGSEDPFCDSQRYLSAHVDTVRCGRGATERASRSRYATPPCATKESTADPGSPASARAISCACADTVASPSCTTEASRAWMASCDSSAAISAGKLTRQACTISPMHSRIARIAASDLSASANSRANASAPARASSASARSFFARSTENRAARRSSRVSGAFMSPQLAA